MGPLALLGIGAGISAVGNIVNNLMSRSNAQFAYDKFNSPAAQVRGFQQAGMNPAVGMSESGGSSGGSQSAPPAPTENPFGMVPLLNKFRFLLLNFQTISFVNVFLHICRHAISIRM